MDRANPSQSNTQPDPPVPEVRLKLRVLGPFQVTLDDREQVGLRSDKTRALLAYLAVESGRPHPRESLAALLWGESSEEAALASLRTSLSNLRRALFPLAPRIPLHFTRQEVEFTFDSSWLDAAQFENWLAPIPGHTHAASARCPACLRRMEQAVELYRGDFLTGLLISDSPTFEEWCRLRQEAYHQQALNALETLTAHYAIRHEHETAQACARRQLALEPWREEAHRALMEQLAHVGQRSAALAQYDLCRRALAEALGVEPSAETTRLYESIRDGRLESPAPPPPALLPLPFLPTTPFIGRVAELKVLVDWLADPACRLITIVGPGGIGKTRLALQIAVTRAAQFEDGVGYGALGAVSSPKFIPLALAQALRYTFYQSGDPQTQILNYLRGRKMLLILDNFEHLRAGAGWLLDLLDRAPGVKVLVTSREQLELPGERVLEIQGLAVTEDGEPETGEAIQLFLESARRVQPEHPEIISRDLATIAQICRRVEGVPLAIELAASWVQVFACDEIDRRIAQDLDFLVTTLPVVSERHRSVRAVVEQSWGLLTPEEQSALLRLSLLRDAFSSRAAREIAGVSPETLRTLARKSLLRQEGAVRWEMHSIIRHYAADKLAADPTVLARIEEAAGRYYAAFLSESADASAQAIAAIGAELENVLTAWEWMIREVRAAEIEQSLTGLIPYYLFNGPIQEGEQLCGTAAAALSARFADQELTPTVARLIARLAVGQAYFFNAGGRYAEAAAAAQKAIPHAEAAADPAALAGSYLHWGRALWALSDYKKAWQYLMQALTLAREAGADPVTAEALRQLGCAALQMGNFTLAQQNLEEALTIVRARGDRHTESLILNHLGLTCSKLPDYARAQSCYEDALKISRAIDDRRCTGMSYSNLGSLALNRGDYLTARHYFEQAGAINREIGDRWSLYWDLTNLGTAALSLGELDRAIEYFERALAVSHEIEQRWSVSMSQANLAFARYLQGRLTEALDHSRQAIALARELQAGEVLHYALTHLGYICLERGELEAARSAYQEAYDLRFHAGHKVMALEPQAGLARIALIQGELPAAQKQIEPLLAHLAESEDLTGIDYPFWMHLTGYRVLQAADDPRAPAVLERAYHQLQARAAQQPVTLRDEFLSIPAHREIVATWTRAQSADRG